METRFSSAAARSRTTAPRGVSATEGWWLVVIAVGLGVSHAFIYQSHAFEWGGILRSLVLLLSITGLAWVGMRASAARRVRPRGHGRLLGLAGAWGVLVVLVAGWFWIVPAQGHEVGWVVTSLVAVIGVLPIALVGLRLVRLGAGRR